MRRRTFLALASATMAAPWDSLVAESAGYPTEVADIKLP